MSHLQVATCITACNDHLFHVCGVQGYFWMLKCQSMVRGHRVTCKVWEFWCCLSDADKDLEYVSNSLRNNSHFTIIVEKPTVTNRIPLDIGSDDMWLVCVKITAERVCPVDNET